MMSSFTELAEKTGVISDLILSGALIQDERGEGLSSFEAHLQSTKQWFIRVSSSNKKKYLLVLLADVSSAYTLALVLRAIWSVRPKDAISSVSKSKVWSSYDQAAMDHDRTARPKPALAQVMADDRAWFLSLEKEKQALLLLELLRMAGGPVLWEVLGKAQTIYERYKQNYTESIKEIVVVSDPIIDKPEKTPISTPKTTNEPISSRKMGSPVSTSDSKQAADSGQQTQKDLDESLASWNAAIKALRDNCRLDKFEVTFKDGTKKKVWRVNRPKSEAGETVDFELVLCYDPSASLEALEQIDAVNTDPRRPAKSSAASTGVKTIEKSTGDVSFKRKLKKDKMCKPLTNLNELTTRLERRGAVDKNLWVWCNNVVNVKKVQNEVKSQSQEGFLQLEKRIFVSPLMKFDIDIPLAQPLFEDPAYIKKKKIDRNEYNKKVDSK